MPIYSSHIDDINVLEALLYDVKLSLSVDSNSFIFDAGVLATVVRNTAIIMNNYLGDNDYSPRAPIKLGCIEPTLTMPLYDLEYEFLQECRRSGERGDDVEVRAISVEKLLGLVGDISCWQHDCVNYIGKMD